MGIIKEPAKGKVIDQATGKPIVGATVSNQSINQRVLTDADGLFTINGSESDQLSITYLGYEVKKVEGTKLETVYPLNRIVTNTCAKPYHEKNTEGVCKFSIGRFVRVNWIYILIILVVLILLIEFHSKDNNDK